MFKRMVQLSACASLASSLTLSAAGPSAPVFRQNAPTPPMGWNSWDNFGAAITEQQARAQADAMAKILKPADYDVFTVDIQWYEPNSQGHGYREGAPLELTGHAAGLFRISPL
jgi:hypothetical protein